MSSSVAFLQKRLADIGQFDLLQAARRGEISTFAAAEAAGLIRTARSRVLGTGSENQAKKRAWAIARITGQSLQVQSEHRPTSPVAPLPKEVADIVRKLVAAGRADLIIAVAEFRLTPFEAEAVVDQGCPPPTPKAAAIVDPNESTEKRTRKRKAASAEPETPKLDVRALIG